MHGKYICLVEVKPLIERMNAGNLTKGHHGTFVCDTYPFLYLSSG